MATPVASNQLITPKLMAQEGIWTNPTNNFLDMTNSSNVNTIAQTIATNAWGSSTNYDTRIMTRQNIINSGVVAQNNITGYSTNQCPPYGPLYNYNNDTFYGSYKKLSWGSAYLNTGYRNYGYVEIYLKSPYYRPWSWNTDRDGYNLNLVCWNGSNSYVGVKNCYVGNGFGDGNMTLGAHTASGAHFKVLDWDGTWAHLMSLPWYDDSGLATSNCYLSIVAVDGWGAFYGRDNECIYYQNHTIHNPMSDKHGVDMYILDTVKLSNNGDRVTLKIQ